jgi:hypothetical protein
MKKTLFVLIVAAVAFWYFKRPKKKAGEKSQTLFGSLFGGVYEGSLLPVLGSSEPVVSGDTSTTTTTGDTSTTTTTGDTSTTTTTGDTSTTTSTSTLPPPPPKPLPGTKVAAFSCVVKPKSAFI